MEASTVLQSSILSLLFEYQIEKIVSMIQDFIEINHAVNETHFDYCPICLTPYPSLVKAGCTKAGKQMLKCKSCGHRFVMDRGQITYYSHQTQDKWNDLITDSQNGISLKDSAAKLKINECTVFRMRHKFLHFLQVLTDHNVVKLQVELDEKYVPCSHKGTKMENVKGKKRGTPARKRGISDEQVCLLTAVDRTESAYLKAFNMARPTNEDIDHLKAHIQAGSFVWVDGLQSYRHLLEECQCPYKVVKDKNEYDAVNHLNNVNSFHGKIEQQYTRYRGVASKYINRYAALFVTQKKYAGKTSKEALLEIMKQLRSIQQYFYIRQITSEDTFDLAF